MKNIIKSIMGLLFCINLEQNQVYSEEFSETYSSDITNSGSLELSAKPRRLIPALTYDTTFKLLFGQEKYLKAFLNDIYGYDSACHIDKIEYLSPEHTGIHHRGRTSCDIRCKCKLNTFDENGVIEFILEMQRKKQSAFMDRTNLESSIVISDDYTRSMSDGTKISSRRRQAIGTIERKKMPSGASHDRKFQENIPIVRHLSILLEDYNAAWGGCFHVAPMVIAGKVYKGNMKLSTIVFPTQKPIIATTKQLHTFIQLKQCVGEISDWLKLLTIELSPERKCEETKDEIDLYDVSDITDPVVEDAIEFIQNQMKSGEERAKLVKELLAIQESEDKDKELERLRKEQAAMKEAKRKAEEKAASEAQARMNVEAENARLKALLEQYQQRKL